MSVRATARRSFDEPIEDVWARVVDADLPAIMPGTTFLPAVAEIRDETGRWAQHTEQWRMIVLADGSAMREAVLQTEAPARLAYELRLLNGAFARLTPGARASFSLVEVAEGTEVTWTYLYDSRSFITWPLVFLIIRFLWQPYMSVVLANLAEA